MSVTNYGVIRDTYIDGGANGKAVGVELAAYRTVVKAINLNVESGMSAVFRSSTTLLVRCIYCHFEGGGFMYPYNVFELNNPNGEWEVLIDLQSIDGTGFTVSLNKVFGTSTHWLKYDRDSTDRLFMPWLYKINSGNVNISISKYGILVSNNGTTDAVVDFPVISTWYSIIKWGTYIEGTGEVMLTDGSTGEAIGINSSGNLYYTMYNLSSPQSVVVDTSGAGAYDVVGFADLVGANKNLTYGVLYQSGYVYTSKTVSINSGNPFGVNFVRVKVPAGKSLIFWPRLYIHQY
jgi:hypothetical protein